MARAGGLSETARQMIRPPGSLREKIGQISDFFDSIDPERTPRRSVAAGSPSCIPQLSDSRRKWFVVVLSRDR